MSTNARQLSKHTEDALMASRRGDFRTASELYFRAAQYAEGKLKNEVLKHLYLHYSYVEKLRDVGGRDQDLIQRIVENLRNMIFSVPDDRLLDKINPILNYFESLGLCCGGHVEGLSEKIRNIRAITDRSPHYLNSLAHVLCESLQIMECIDTYERGSRAFREQIREKKEALLECVKKRRQDITMPPEIGKCFETFEACLENVSDGHLAIETCIRGFDRLLTNPNHKILFFATEALRSPISRILSHYQETEKESRSFIPEVLAGLKGQPTYDDVVIMDGSKVEGSFLSSPDAFVSERRRMIIVRESSIADSFKDAQNRITASLPADEVPALIASIIQKIKLELRNQIIDQSQAMERTQQLLTRLETELGKKRYTKIVRELGLSTSPPFIKAEIKVVTEDKLD